MWALILVLCSTYDLATTNNLRKAVQDGPDTWSPNIHIQDLEEPSGCDLTQSQSKLFWPLIGG